MKTVVMLYALVRNRPHCSPSMETPGKPFALLALDSQE